LEGNWFRHLSVASPMRLFCIPHHIPNAAYFEEVNRSAGLTLDRARIVLLAENANYRDKIIASAKTGYWDLVNLVMKTPGVEPQVPAQQRQKAVAERHSQ
jgi:hypothetical protein